MIRRGPFAKLVATVCLAASAFTLSPASPAGAAAGFGDVAAGEFYTAPIQWMVNEGLASGVSPGCFVPAQSASRAEVAVFLHRYASTPTGGAEGFHDVGPADFSAEAVAWMAGTGITTGSTPTTFEPHANVTRGQIATFLHRFMGRPDGGSEPFVDVPSNAFYTEAVAWMVANGITTGTSATTFHPERPVTRGELATFLYRLDGEPSVQVDPGGRCEALENADLIEAEEHSWLLLNELRSSVGLPSIPRSAGLDSFARDWSATMAATGDFAHSGGPYGENIAWTSRASASPVEAAQRLHNLWENSSGHYANMTRTTYTAVGIGFWHGPDGWHATHVFS